MDVFDYGTVIFPITEGLPGRENIKNDKSALIKT